LGTMHLVSERLGWALQRALASRCTGAGWALVGDAAHNVHPLAGQGLNLGLADVQTLATVLAKRESHRSVGDAKLLRRYERARSLGTAAMSQATDGIFRLFAHTDSRVQALGRWGVKLFDGSTGLKSWTIRQAMGV
jgi:2-polyprenyl-6-methoxyphenol hydroxylase-like FAD-dependent oxidoreductase